MSAMHRWKRRSVWWGVSYSDAIGLAQNFSALKALATTGILKKATWPCMQKIEP